MEDTTVATEIVPLEVTDPLAGTGYTVVDRIGKGGMGTVYCAQHQKLGHLVAVKVLHVFLQTGAANLQLMDRGRIEGQIGARFSHPNLVAVHDYGKTTTGNPYMVMDRLVGETLHQRLERAGNGPLPIATSLDIACQALHGLQAVHEAGLIHRDIKPTNLFLCEDDTVKVLDLGCAKIIEYTTHTPDSLTLPTAEGMFVGTPRYMAPEQSALGVVDRRADLYAVGCVLYRMLCGRGPFDEARTFDELQQAHQHQLPLTASSHLQAPLPPALDDVLVRCLSKDPNDRPASAEALAAELRRIELEVREGLGGSYVTDTLRPPTPMDESQRLWQRPESVPAPRGSVTVKQLAWIIAACLLVGGVLGGFVVSRGWG